MQVYFDTIPKYRSDGLVLVDKVSDINVKFIQVSLQFRIIMTMFRVNMGQREDTSYFMNQKRFNSIYPPRNVYVFCSGFHHFDHAPWLVPRNKSKSLTILARYFVARTVPVGWIWSSLLVHDFLCIDLEKRQQSAIQDSWLLVAST